MSVERKGTSMCFAVFGHTRLTLMWMFLIWHLVSTAPFVQERECIRKLPWGRSQL